MPIEIIHTYLVRPRVPDVEAQVTGAELQLEGDLFDLLRGIYDKSDAECDIEISFNRGNDGAANNPCRTLLTDYLNQPTVEGGRALARRLSDATTNRSGLGLLFVMCGSEGPSKKIVISRFPTDKGILAEEDRQSLSVEFLDRVFMKNAFSYKAATFSHVSLIAGFWDGRVVDKQISSPSVQASDYWIRKFLDADFRTTGAQGTKQLAVALKAALKAAPSIALKQELGAAATLAPRLDGRPTSISAFCEHHNLSGDARALVEAQVNNDRIFNRQFRLDAEEFSRNVIFRSIELDSGAMLTAQASDFDAVFRQERVGDGGEVRFSTEGTIVDEKLRQRI